MQKNIHYTQKKVGTDRLNIELKNFPISAGIDDVTPVWIHTTISERINFIISILDCCFFSASLLIYLYKASV